MKLYALLDHRMHPDVPFHIQRGHIDGPFPLHVHDFDELVVVTGGSGVHAIDGFSYDVQAGDIYMVLGDTAHGFTRANGLTMFNLMLPSDFCDPEPASGFRPLERSLRAMPGFQALFILEPYYRREHRFMNRLRVTPAQLDEIGNWLETMATEYETHPDGFQAMLQADLVRLFVRLSRWMAQPEVPATGNLLPLSQALAYMEAHFAEPLTLSMLAGRAFLSERHFSRIFQDNCHQSPMAYLQALRLSHACGLLRRNDRTVTEIAQACGYADSNLFSRLFARRYRMTPSAYRKHFGLHA